MSVHVAWTRAASIKRLDEAARFDVVVVGGGIIGAAVALDAASRGLSVALVEQNDFVSGSSSKSTKLLHGGIRYLPHFQFGLIREGLSEQKILARTADYLYHPLDFAIPLFDGLGMADLPKWASHPRIIPYSLRAGLAFYDLLGLRRSGDRHHKLSIDEIRTMVPSLRTQGLKGGFSYRDAQTDDVRLTIAVLKTAVTRHDVVAVSRMRANDVIAETDGYRIAVTDTTTGDELAIRARSVISATWAFRPPPLQGGEPAPPVQLSKGVHVLYRAADLKLGSTAIVLPETDDGRVLFVIPWFGMALLGTTDTPFHGDAATASADDEDIEYLTRHLDRYLDSDGATPVSSFAGVRALVDSGAETAQASREHSFVEAGPGYVQITGGKLTAFRSIAADAVDRLKNHLRINTASTTASEKLAGAGVSAESRAAIETEVSDQDLDTAYAGALIDRLGIDASEITRLLREQPELRRTIGERYSTLAEVAYMARHESVMTVADFALRRTHLAWSADDHGRSDATAIAETLGRQLGWSADEVAAAVFSYEHDLRVEGL